MADFLIWLKDSILTLFSFPGIIFVFAAISICVGICEYARCKRIKDSEDEKERKRRETLDKFN